MTDPKTKKIFNVAILVDTTTSWSRSLISGILQYTREHEPWHIHMEAQPRDDRLHLPKNWKGDGIIARISTEQLGEQLDATGAKIVNISSISLKNNHWPRVITGADSEAAMAFNALRSRGFRQFAYAGDTRLLYVNSLCRAFEKVVTAAGYPLHISPAHTEHLECWLRQLPKPVALYCWGPALGHEIIDTCMNAGIRVPHDIAVLGSNYDELISEASYPPQAGIRMATEQIGMTAALLLDSMMRGKKPKKMEWHLEPQGVVERLSIDSLAVSDLRMAAIMKFIKEHFLEPISVPDILKAHPMARRSLERKFKHYFGCSVIEQIQRLRINHARTLLSDTDAPIALVAEQSRFSSYNYLNRTFKQHTGLSPSQYRAQFRTVMS